MRLLDLFDPAVLQRTRTPFAVSARISPIGDR
jgi:hypothetical protein